MYTVISVRDPRWADLAHTAISMWVLFEEFKDTYGEVPFGASPKDPEPHGVDLYNRAVAGEFGPVLEPTEETIVGQVMSQRDALSGSATARINALVTELDMLQDAIAMNLATEKQVKSVPAIKAELYAFRLYRVRLSQIDTLEGYPRKFDWPAAPAQPFVYVPAAE
ncbi:phage tail protein [Pseudomonas viridiflava]|uniref:Tail fiber assembly domain-containing protein n=1 Tax=Pseudomonas viridiflava TaxID=33069 RepID=A0A3M5PC55_PSEVI|nr:phage tail protein [Pseudomonas viridiflava]RMT82239.1 Tail fiber assembly domain-containing protein [Pseudomonas viridiflava]